jgi:hypothetical protein
MMSDSDQLCRTAKVVWADGGLLCLAALPSVFHGYVVGACGPFLHHSID